MSRINLESPSSSHIPIEIIRFPDGQQDLRILSKPSRTDDRVVISSRMNGFKDVELIILAKKALDNIGYTKPVELYIPYLLGGRSDRLFVEGGVRYIKDVIAPIINSLGFSKVTTLDPHSDVMENVIDRMEKTTFSSIFIQQFVERFSNPFNFTLVAPDAGASKKIFDIAKSLNTDRIVVCGKHRDVKTGKILETIAPSVNETKNLVVCDDICDGGRTFVEIAKAFKAKGYAGDMHLFVTHGIFSSASGYHSLCEHYSSITTTNSILESLPKVQLYSCNVEQINIF
jgi:ribose-phosphate pyrophosphokinase